MSVASRVLLSECVAVLGEWAELCRWDPSLPPDSQPIEGELLLVAVAHALDRPQPIGWGVDPEVEDAVLHFAARPASVGEAVGQIACLREALARRLRGRLAADEVEETWLRLGVILDRAIGCAAQRLADRIEADAVTDPLTGLGNRRAFDRDVRRELARAMRHERRFSVAVLDLDGLKAVNDRDGHAAGDAALRQLGGALSASLRTADRAYRLGGDEFAVLLPETPPGDAESALARLASAGGVPSFSWGVAAYPFDADADDVAALVDLADRRLYERKGGLRRPERPGGGAAMSGRSGDGELTPRR